MITNTQKLGWKIFKIDWLDTYWVIQGVSFLNEIFQFEIVDT